MAKQLIQDQLHAEEKTSGSFDRSSHHNGGKMKTHFVKMLLILSLVIAGGNVIARAQGLIDDTDIEADVPHAFIVRDTTLPAGKYLVKRVDDNDTNILEIRSADGRTAVVFETETTQANQTPRQAEMVFDKIGDKYFLSKIWTTESKFGYELPKTKAEKRLEDGGLKAEQHSITARLSKRTKNAK
jgi:hypothetical protein